MKNINRTLIILLIGYSSYSHSADGFAQTGFTGYLRTPNAQVIDHQSIHLGMGWESNVDHNSGYQTGAHNTLMVGTGLFPGLEFVIQNTYKNFQGDPGYNQGNAGSDLSFSAKLNSQTVLPDSPVQFAVGVQDYGTHDATYHNNYYFVAQYSLDAFDISIGRGRGDNQNQMSEQYLDGLFGGARWKVNEYLDLIADHDGTGTNAGLRLTAPSNWLPDGWELSTTLQGFTDSSAENRDNTWLALGLKIDLGHDTRKSAKTYQYKTYGLDNTAWQAEHQPQIATLPETQPSSRPAHATATPDLHHILAKLNKLGLENLRAGEIDNIPVIAYENNLYLHNELDALGAALGIVSQDIKGWYYLIMQNNRIPMFGVKAHGGYLLEARAKAARPHIKHLQYIQRDLAGLVDQVQWQTKTIADSRYLPRIHVSLAQRSTLGTEWGVMDYSSALATNAVFDLWEGASLDIRHLYPLVDSDDADYRGHPITPYENSIDQVLLHQALPLNDNLFTQFSVGKVLDDYAALINESRWQSDTGQHRLSVVSGLYEPLDNSGETDRQTALAYYRYYFPDARHGIELFGGRYLNDDTGVGIRTLHWFDDTQVNLELKTNDDRVFAGLYFAFPLAKSKSMRPDGFQLTGVDEWRWGYRTQVNSDKNIVNNAVLVEPRLEHNLERTYFNRDRLSLQYFYANLPTIMSAMQSVIAND